MISIYIHPESHTDHLTDAQLAKALTRASERLDSDGASPNVVNTEVEIDADYDLRYEYVVEAITAVSGYVDRDTGLIKKIVEKIKFAPRHP